MTITFLHFDSAQRANRNDDPFKSSFTLANSIRNVKNIYLKSAEIPCGFFNIRSPQIFSFVLSSSKDIDTVSQLASITYTPKQKTNFNLVVSTANNASANQNPYLPYFVTRTRNILPLEPIVLKIVIPIGNYTIDSLIQYLNDAIKNLYSVFYMQFNIMGTSSPVLSKVQVSASSSFPVGYIQLSAHPNVYITMLSNILGFSGTENNFTPITSTNLYNLNPDLSLYLYFPNIPHKNTHFNNQLISFKIPVSSGYQSIEFNAENLNFAQYIELQDSTFILNKIELIVNDRQGNVVNNNGYDWTFTLAIETDTPLSLLHGG
jgi:hypothetical protein